jgi:hypothetical protein
VVAPNTTIVTYVPADKSELKPGANASLDVWAIRHKAAAVPPAARPA